MVPIMMGITNQKLILYHNLKSDGIRIRIGKIVGEAQEERKTLTPERRHWRWVYT